jgi:hypothetical protein
MRHRGQMQLRAPAIAYDPPGAADAGKSLWAFAYVAAVMVVVVASVGVLAGRSNAFSSSGTAPRAAGSPAAEPVLRVRDYALQIRSLPSRFGQPAVASVRVLRAGHAVDDARVRVTFSMPAMPEMRGLSVSLRPSASGVYARSAPALTVGRWRASFWIAPRHSAGFTTGFTYRIES